MCSYIHINYYIHIYIIIPFIQLYMSLYAAVARRFCESSRHISRPYNLQPHQQRCVYRICNQKPYPPENLKLLSYFLFLRIKHTPKSIIHMYLPILHAAECNHAATNSVILYINRTHEYIHTHIVIFNPYKIFTIYKFTHHCTSSKT